MKKKGAPQLVAFLTVAIDLLGFGIVLPLLPVYADHFLGDVDPKWHGAILGSLMASFSLMQFLFMPGWGRLSDRIGRRPVILVGLGSSALFYALFGFATVQQSLLLLFVARIGAGIAGATIGTAQAIIADATPPEKRARGMALIGMAFGIGFTLGPLLGTFLANPAGEPPSAGPGFLAAGLSLAAFLFAFFRLPETSPMGQAPKRPWFNLDGWKLALGTRSIAGPLLTFFVVTLAFAGFETTIARYAKDDLSLSFRQMGYLFAYIGFVLMIMQGFIVRRLLKKWSEKRMIIIGIVMMLVGLVAVAIVDAMEIEPNLFFNLALGAMAMAVSGYAFVAPSAQALVSRQSSALRQGEVLGVNQAAASIARILGPLYGNILYGSAADDHSWPFYGGAALVIVAWVLAMRIEVKADADLSPDEQSEKVRDRQDGS